MHPMGTRRPRLATALSEALSAYHVPTGVHSRRVGSLAREVGVVLGLEGPELECLWQAALLHDLGKLGVSEGTLSKPGPLDPNEREEIECHPAIGADIVRACVPGAAAARGEEFERVAVGILEHHERWDGSGYPYGRQGEEISTIGRILGPIDVYDSMIELRYYRPRTFRPDEALAHLREGSGTLFDPAVVPAVVEVIERSAARASHGASVDDAPSLDAPGEPLA
ncbi:MAG: HD domain-containing protein [Actinomycetota bacterium]|nr:HD domain-containing protein [Actinomycetota bacterium]